jgi:hypothetical protein
MAVAVGNTLVAPTVTESALRDSEILGCYWTDPYLPDRVVSALFQTSEPAEATMADMSEWPPELDAESRAIHRDLARASFRSLTED